MHLKGPEWRRKGPEQLLNQRLCSGEGIWHRRARDVPTRLGHVGRDHCGVLRMKGEDGQLMQKAIGVDVFGRDAGTKDYNHRFKGCSCPLL